MDNNTRLLTAPRDIGVALESLNIEDESDDVIALYEYNDGTDPLYFCKFKSTNKFWTIWDRSEFETDTIEEMVRIVEKLGVAA